MKRKATFYQRRRDLWKYGIREIVLLVVSIFLVYYMITVVWGLFRDYRLALKEAHIAQVQYQEALNRKHELQEKIDSLKTERGQEEHLRERFQLSRPGEKAVVLLDEEDNERSVSSTSTHWWQNFFSWLNGQLRD